MRVWRFRVLLFTIAAWGLIVPGLIALGAPSRAEEPPVSINAVLQALQQNDTAGALRQCDQLLRVHPRSDKLYTLRGAVLERAGRPREAAADYAKALAINPQYLPALKGAAQLEYKARSAKAERLLRRILALEPGSTTAHAMMGVIEYRQKQYAAAAADFDHAGNAVRAEPDALLAYAVCLVHLDRLSQALPLFEQVVAMRPESETARYDLAMVQWQSVSAAQALATLTPLLDNHLAGSRTLRLAADIHEAQDDTPPAVELLRAAIMADPHDAANYVDFATLAFMHGSFDVGIDMINRGLTQLPRSSALYMARGVLYGQNSEYEKAMADFEQAHRLDPGFSMTATAEGIAQSQRHDHAAALVNFRRQVAEHPTDALGHYLLAEALSWAPPEDGGTLSANTLAEAIREAQKAIALDHRLVEAYDLAATLYLQDGKIAEAVRASRAALALNSRDQQALYSLILALRKTGDKDELKNLVQRLTELRKTDTADNERRKRYGRLVEEPLDPQPGPQ